MAELSALLQLADAAFPSGAFGHSFGLETAIQELRIGDGPSLEAWVTAYVVDGAATMDGRALVLALRDGAALEVLDRRLAAAQPNEEIRRANRHLARATLQAYEALCLTDESIVTYTRTVASGACDGNHALAAGLGYRAAGATVAEALEAYATSLVGGFVSAAARAVPLGQQVAVSVRWRLREAVRAFVARAWDVRGIDDLAWSAIGCEIDGLRHRALAGRLFAS